jgi:Protein of unknown function (DUF429)
VTLGTAGESPAASIAQWIAGAERFVLAFDAPLGWPAGLASAIGAHEAGTAIPQAPDALFRRQTDHLVHRTLGKWPLEVGADRIARTAHAALAMLAEVRRISERRVPLAWWQASDSGAIEVFPAATLLTRGLPGARYKADTTQGRRARAEILQRLGKETEICVTHDLMVEDADQLDALLCVVAGADFARGACVEPEDLAMAKKEGFIWFRTNGQRKLPIAGV